MRDTDVQKTIREAVERLPHILGGTPHPIAPEYLHAQRTRRRWLWSIVTPLTILVFVMWFLNAKGAARNLLAAQSQETEIVANIQDDFTAVLDSIQAQEEKTELEAAVQKEYGDGVRDELRGIFQTLTAAAAETTATNTQTTSTQ
ncbi:MAG: hypothetical protein AAB932_01495 [Patescibacteria group bacterium]